MVPEQIQTLSTIWFRSCVHTHTRGFRNMAAERHDVDIHPRFQPWPAASCGLNLAGALSEQILFTDSSHEFCECCVMISGTKQPCWHFGCRFWTVTHGPAARNRGNVQPKSVNQSESSTRTPTHTQETHRCVTRDTCCEKVSFLLKRHVWLHGRFIQ